MNFFYVSLKCIDLYQETSLELASINEDGIIQSIFEQSVFGTIKDIAVLPWKDRYRVSPCQVHCFSLNFIFLLFVLFN